MIEFYVNSSVYIQVLIATLMTWGITSLGAAIVFFFKKVNNTILDGMLALSAGVMLAASFWSLLNPAVIQADALGMKSWLIVSIGFISGCVVIILGDLFFSKILNKRNSNNVKGKKRGLMLIFSITLHNIPEGLAIGVAFGSIASGIEGVTLLSAFMLALGIGIQNFPEGTAVSLPLRREKLSRIKSFFYGSISGVVEPVSGLIGCILVMYVRNVLPFFLAFAAGAMIYVVVSELVPESQKNNNRRLMSIFSIIGFVIMMILDIALG